MFLEKILPPGGMYCVAQLLPAGGFKQFFLEDLGKAQEKITALDKAGHNCYIAQATFDHAKTAEALAHNKALPRGLSKAEWRQQAKKTRPQANATHLKTFFLDIDCGEKWPLKNQNEGVESLKQFIADTGLPFPAVVNSGNGLYAHWILDEPVPAQQWRTIAFILKKVVAAYSPAIGGDASRTSDSASVLRPVGTTNRKPGFPEKHVALLRDMEPIKFIDFVDALNKAARKKKINSDAARAPKPVKDLNAEFYSGLELKSVPSDANQIADRCRQLGHMREVKGDVEEPLWYACLGVLNHCDGGSDIAQEWSSGHPHYSRADTEAKLQQWSDADVGPSTCANLGALSPQRCIGCPSNGKIKSPIVLGRPDPEKKALPEEQCAPPEGFRRGKDGLYAEEDGRWFKFYDQDLYVDLLAYDESLDYEVMTIKHHLPHDGDMECTVRSSSVNDPKALMILLADNHIKVIGVKEKKLMVAYLESYQAQLQRKHKMTMLLCQMGWKKAKDGSPMFVLGRKILHADGSVEDASMARNVPIAVEGYHTKGSLAKWSKATTLYNMPGMEPYAFALLAGGFGAPLMKFTGFEGAIVSLVGKSGSGKTLTLRMIQSIWGKHTTLMMLRGDTQNSLLKRLGAYGNLPMCIDEVTNIKGMDTSDLAYQITQGREKTRLNRNAEERTLTNSWNTLAVTSSNSSLVDKLTDAKHDASPEINRVFEYPAKHHPDFQGHTTKTLYWMLNENYGHAGEAYIKYLVQRDPDEIKLALSTILEQIEAKAELNGDERYWGAIASVAIYGGLIAQKLGLIEIDVPKIFKWAIDTLYTMRGDKQELAGNSIDILAQFIDAHTANMLIVKGNPNKRTCVAIQLPRGPLDVRFELDYQRMYISRSVLKEWLGKRYGSYTLVKKELVAAGALTDPNKRKVLGAGTILGGAQQICWEVNMSSAALGAAAGELTRIAEMLDVDETNEEAK